MHACVSNPMKIGLFSEEASAFFYRTNCHVRLCTPPHEKGLIFRGTQSHCRPHPGGVLSACPFCRMAGRLLLYLLCAERSPPLGCRQRLSRRVPDCPGPARQGGGHNTFTSPPAAHSAGEGGAAGFRIGSKKGATYSKARKD